MTKNEPKMSENDPKYTISERKMFSERKGFFASPAGQILSWLRKPFDSKNILIQQAFLIQEMFFASPEEPFDWLDKLYFRAPCTDPLLGLPWRAQPEPQLYNFLAPVAEPLSAWYPERNDFRTE